jgi:hypothetical protein
VTRFGAKGDGVTDCGIDIRDMTVDSALRALSLRGYADTPIQDVGLTRVNFKRVSQPDIVEHVTGLKLREVYENGRRLPDTAAWE